jgi:hypothetical protein
VWRFIARRRYLQVILLCLLAIVIGTVKAAGNTAPIDSYAACIEAGYPVLGTEPPICRAGNQNFTGTPSPPPPTAEPSDSVPFDVLVDGDTHDATPAHSQKLINTQSDWRAYWRSAHAGLPSIPPLIPVDFAKSSVVAVSLGAQPTSGYGLKITSINASETGSVINVTETTPTVTCAVAQMKTNRYLIVSSSKIAEPVTFRITSDKRSCL